MSRPYGQERQIFSRSQAAAAAPRQPLAVSPVTERPKRPNIFLKVDTPTADQSVANHEEIHVSGWLAANEPVIDVSVEIDDARFRAETGVHRPDLAETYPNVPALAHAGFAVCVRVPAPV